MGSLIEDLKSGVSALKSRAPAAKQSIEDSAPIQGVKEVGGAILNAGKKAVKGTVDTAKDAVNGWRDGVEEVRRTKGKNLPTLGQLKDSIVKRVKGEE